MVSCRTARECTSGFRGCLGPEKAGRGLGIGEPPICCVMLDSAPETACTHATSHITIDEAVSSGSLGCDCIIRSTLMLTPYVC